MRWRSSNRALTQGGNLKDGPLRQIKCIPGSLYWKAQAKEWAKQQRELEEKQERSRTEWPDEREKHIKKKAHGLGGGL